MYPSSISRALCSDGIRCIKPLAPSRNETNSSRVSGGAVGAILGICSYGGRDQADMDAFAVEYIAVHDRPPIEVPHAKGCACWAAIARQIALGLFPPRLLGRLLARVLREDMQERIRHGPYRLSAN